MGWTEAFQKGFALLCGEYGIYIDEKMGNDTFEYLIADPYTDGRDVPEGFITRTIPELTWAVFPRVGAMSDVLQDEKYYCVIWIPVKTLLIKEMDKCVKMWNTNVGMPILEISEE